MQNAENPDTGLLAPGWAGTSAAALLGDEAWVRAMLDVEAALARAQARLGVLPESAADAIAAVRDLDVAAVARGVRDTGNPVVALVAELTAAAAPEAAGYVHRGATSQDILDSAAMLLAARAFRVVDEALAGCAAALAGLAESYRDTPMAGRTLGQHAVPTTFGLKAAGWLMSIMDARERIAATRTPVQLGGAAGTLASYVEYAALAGAATDGHGARLAEEMAGELGLAVPAMPWHTLRTPIADVAAGCAVVCGSAGKIGLDVQSLSRTEVGELAEPAAGGRGGSSAMPQKRNPVLATLLVTAARQVPAYTGVLYQSMLAEDERSAGGWHAEWQPLRECLRLTVAAAENLRELVRGLEVRPAAMRANLAITGGALVTERLTVALTPVLGRGRAKDVLGTVAREAAAGDRPFADLLRATPELHGHLDPAAIDELLAPENYLGEAGALVDRALARYRAA